MGMKRMAAILALALVLAGCAGKGTGTDDQSAEAPASVSGGAQLSGEPEQPEEGPKDPEVAKAPDPLDQYYRDIRDGLAASGERSWAGLSREEMLEDLDYLFDVLEENYPYFGVVKRTTGYSMEELFQQARADIEAGESDMDLLLALYDLTEATGHAGHFSFLWNAPVAGEDNYRGAYEVYDPIAQAAYAVYLETTGRGAEESNVTTRIVEEGKTAYINILSFHPDAMDGDRDILLDFYREVADYDNLIIDISSNSGGAMNYYWQLIMGPNLAEPVGYYTYIFLKDGELNRQHMINRGTALEESYVPVSSPPSQMVEELREEYGPYLTEELVEEGVRIATQTAFPPALLDLEDFADFDYYSLSPMQIGPTREELLFKGNIWVLVSDQVYSSSESFAIACKQTGFATLVGTRTGGDGIGIDPVVFSLPNSGLWMRYAPIYGATLDGRGSEEFGTDPDILCREGESPLEACLRAIDQG